MAHGDKIKFVVSVSGSQHALYLDDEIVTLDVSSGAIVSVVPIPSRKEINAFKRAQKESDAS